MIIIVGLGNVGAMYQNTFHNIGFKVVDKLAEKLSISFKSIIKKFSSTLI